MLKLIITEDNLNNTRVGVGLLSQDHVKYWMRFKGRLRKSLQKKGGDMHLEKIYVCACI